MRDPRTTTRVRWIPVRNTDAGHGDVAGRSFGYRPAAACTVTGRGIALVPTVQLRCPWAMSSADYVDYHDREWGRPIRSDNAIFERLTLEAFQSGLSWLTILRKRESFRRAFAGFDIASGRGVHPRGP